MQFLLLVFKKLTIAYTWWYDAIFFGNIPLQYYIFGVWLSQGSAATLIRWDGWSAYRHMCRSFLNPTAKTALESVHFDEVTDKIIWLLLWPTV